jgi:hypothetical protein
MNNQKLRSEWEEYSSFRSSDSGYELVLSFIDREGLTISGFLGIFKGADGVYEYDHDGLIHSFLPRFGLSIKIGVFLCQSRLEQKHPKTYRELLSLHYCLLNNKYYINREIQGYLRSNSQEFKFYDSVKEGLIDIYGSHWKKFKLKTLRPSFKSEFENLAITEENPSVKRGVTNQLAELERIEFWLYGDEGDYLI